MMKMRMVRGGLLLFWLCVLAHRGSAGEIATPQFNLPRPEQVSLAGPITVELFHSGDSSVVDATYLRVLFIQSALGTSLPRSGHEAANVS
jgi:hypothetical protein